jgi:hypothetical protein
LGFEPERLGLKFLSQHSVIVHPKENEDLVYHIILKKYLCYVFTGGSKVNVDRAFRKLLYMLQAFNKHVIMMMITIPTA